MFGRGKRRQLKENVVDASALALQLAQDKTFRKRLLSAIEHSSKAGRRARRGLGLTGTLRRLATDQTLLAELRSARDDLQHAYGRLEAKRRTQKLRKFALLAGLASVAAVPQLRQRIAALLAKIQERQRPTEVASGLAAGDSTESPSRPGALEDLTREELYARAQEADIPGRSEMSKQQLIDALRAQS